MGKWRALIGILLIAAAALGLIFWELEGRERVTSVDILVACEEILPGTLLEADMFKVISAPEGSRIERGIAPENVDSLQGNKTLQYIPANSQITAEYFSNEDLFLEKEESVFQLKPEWITARSSSLRRGDTVDVYEDLSRELIGTFKVAFVKDNTELEVEDIAGLSRRAVLDRTDSTSMISHVEILTTIDQYGKLMDYAVSGAGFILVQKENGIQAENDVQRENGGEG